MNLYNKLYRVDVNGEMKVYKVLKREEVMYWVEDDDHKRYRIRDYNVCDEERYSSLSMEYPHYMTTEALAWRQYIDFLEIDVSRWLRQAEDIKKCIEERQQEIKKAKQCIQTMTST